MDCVQLIVSAENVEQAHVIREALLKKKVILGGSVISGPARFWWKGDIADMPHYSYLFAYTLQSKKEAVTMLVENSCTEEIPMLSFIPFEGNAALERLIHETIQ